MGKIKNIIEQNKDSVKKIKKIPGFKRPMLATLTDDYFDDPDWLYERKLDGERVVIYKDSKTVDMMTRNKKNVNFRYPEIEKAIKGNPSDIIIDGEIVTFEKNITSFSKLQQRMHLSSREEAERSDVKIYYYVFDITYVDNYDISSLALRNRKKILYDIIDFKGPIKYVRHINEKGKDYHKRACKKGWEGIIAKDAGSRYLHKRSKKWLKFKCVNRQEFIIAGYTEPKGSRVGFGALLLGYYKKNDLRYAGEVGTGFDDKTLKELSKRLGELEISSKPFSESEKTEERNVTWIKPDLVAEVGFTEWTSSGKLRHPRFLGLREDKDPGKVKREKPR